MSEIPNSKEALLQIFAVKKLYATVPLWKVFGNYKRDSMHLGGCLDLDLTMFLVAHMGSDHKKVYFE